MIIAFCGTHCVGKTTTLNEIKKRYPEIVAFHEAPRHQMPAFDYNTPYELINEIGIGSFELITINSWSIIDHAFNKVLDMTKTIMCDRSAIDNYVYYLTLRKSENDIKLESVLKKMATYYTSLVDMFIYFPVMPHIPLVSDNMRLGDKKYQLDVDDNIIIAMKRLHIPPEKIHNIRGRTVEERVLEIIKLSKQNGLK